MKVPRLVVAGVSSSSGKTTVVTGLIGALKNKGFKVKPFKIGPDYIDTGYLSSVSGEDALNLDLWLMGKKNILPSFVDNAADSDIAVIEGVMGLFDGGDCSTAEVSKYLKAPILLCVNSEKIGESVSAIVKGFLEFDPEVNIIGTILTKVSGTGHYELLKESIENSTQIPVCGYLLKDDNLAVKERHLGLVTVHEKDFINKFVNSAAMQVRNNFNLDLIIKKASLAPELSIDKKDTIYFKSNNKAQYNVKVAYSYDRAFNFFYHENIKIMESMGAECSPFSPIDDSYIDPDIDLLVLWGGFPEVFASDLSSNRRLINQIKGLIERGTSVYAECGGLTYLAKNFISGENKKYPMVGALPIDIKLGDKLAGFGYKEAVTRFDTILGKAGTKVRGHEFHYSFEFGKVGDNVRPYKVKRKSGDKESEKLEGYVYKNVFASYIHLHFLGNLGVINNIFKNINTSKKDRKRR